MFSSFDSVNMPGAKLWDFSKSTAVVTSQVCLEDDCAPFQYFATGGSTAGIIVQLPSNSVTGKIITIKNDKFTASGQNVFVFDPASAPAASANAAYAIGQGQSLSFICFPDAGRLVTNRPVQWLPLQNASLMYASNAAHSSVFGGYGNSAQSDYAFVGGGSSNIASGSNSVIAGGSSNTASGSTACVASGASNTASGTQSFVGGGGGNVANSSTSCIAGGSGGTTRSIVGMAVFPAASYPVAVSSGVSQAGLLILGTQTTDATVTTLRSNSSAAGSTNQLVLPNNSAYYFRGSVIANVTGAGNTKAWTFDGAIKRGATAGSTVLVGVPTVTSSYADAGASAWTIALAADTTNGGLQVTVTGQASTTIRWVCRLESTEVTF